MFSGKGKKGRGKADKSKNVHYSFEPSDPEFIDASLSVNLAYMKEKTGNSPDIAVRQLKIGDAIKVDMALVYVEALVDNDSISDFLIESLLRHDPLEEKVFSQNLLETISKEIVSLKGIEAVNKWSKLFEDLMNGHSIIFIEGMEQALSSSTEGGEKRAIEESSTNVTLRGPRESFTESIDTNIGLIRRIIKNPNLWTESMKIGEVSNTDVTIMFLNGIAKKETVEEVRERLKRISIDGVLESGYIEQLIEDQTLTSFPTIYHTDRPDTVAANLLEGRIAILVNGTPFVLLVPALFIQFFQAIEDYYIRYDIATAIRFLRILVFSISLIGPAVYIAATTFHQEMIPSSLAIIVAAQREPLPFPAFIEALIMEIAFEILREAGVRMPKAIGSTISIVGALVIGQAAIQAGIVSSAMVIVVSITAIASYATPSYSIAISARLIRFFFMLSAATFGFYGMILAFIFILVHLCSLRSFGVPYMYPFAPFNLKEAGDTIIRKPTWAFNSRPEYLNDRNKQREGAKQRPTAPKSRNMINFKAEKGERNES
ncbi:spore germination protein [Bacillus massiliglaciei]|uniref:spore germination protein n=1 Tax=Bacillus massiliglaciei TaxID=1816693 RepID=UPI000A53D368|nr:spore germination protein [Bacillus massiliglaciei]